MAPFSIPVPSIVPLRLPVFGGPKSFDTDTKVELLCDTFLDYEIFYTLDGTKPQPYAGIVQGNKTIKYKSPFCLPPGKITIKAIAVNANIHSMFSNIVTKRFEILKGISNQATKEKKAKDPKLKKQKVQQEDENNKLDRHAENPCDDVDNRFATKLAETNGENGNCLEEAFIDSFEFEVVNDNIEENDVEENETLNGTSDDEVSENNVIPGEFEDAMSYAIASDSHLMDDNVISSSKAVEQCIENKALILQNGVINANNQKILETQFCCLKCDMTLQQCVSCKRMNTVSSKFCIECGVQLTTICYSCKEHNPSVASFCQFCGNKLGAAVDGKQDIHLKVDSYVMAKPQLRHAGIQQWPVLVNKGTQTLSRYSHCTGDCTPVKKGSPKFDMKRIPRQSPGRGYWHQQLDYICNHLKSHAYNNVEFRKTISEPILCDFQSAHITKDENGVSVTVTFSPYEIDKTNMSESEETKPKGSS